MIARLCAEARSPVAWGGQGWSGDRVVTKPIPLCDHHHLRDGVLENVEARERLHVMAETAEHFQLLHRLPDLQEDGRLVAPCVGPHDEA